jgi:plasmid replication initiation protein
MLNFELLHEMDITTINPNLDHNKLVVTQANALARSAQEMTLQEKRLLLLVISQIRQNDDQLIRYCIPITAIQDYLELNGKDIYTRIKAITKKLLSRVLEIEKPNGKGWQQFQWVSYCEYVQKEESKIEEACVEIQLHDHLRPMLLNLQKHFGSIPLLQIAPN